MNFGDWASAVQDVIQAAAIVIGGAWAYYKFVRGRTFHRRAELRLQATWAPGTVAGVEARAEMENTGGANIPLRAKILRAASFVAGNTDEDGRPIWTEVAHAPVFADHDWIESQETISDDVLIPLANIDQDMAALRVTCFVYEHRKKKWYRRRKGGGIAWTAHSILLRPKEVENAGQRPVIPEGGGRGGDPRG